MNQVKKVNIVFMVSAIMPYIARLFLELTGLRIHNSLQEILFSQLIYVLPTIVYLCFCGMSPLKALRLKKIRISNVFLLILFTYLISPFISLINAISLVFSENMISDTITDMTGEFPLILCILAVGVVPAICEESVYRGVLYNEYRKVNPKLAIVFSALLFGLLHQNLNQFAYAFVLGLIFALVIEATDSILATMIIHFVINSTSIVLNYALPRLYNLLERLYGSDVFDADALYETAMESTDKVTMIQSAYSLIIPALIGLVLAFFVFRVIAKNENRYDHVKDVFRRKEDTKGIQSLISIPLLIGIAICIYNIIRNLIG